MSKRQPPASAPVTEPPPTEENQDSLLFLLTRVYWMGFGPALVILLLIAVVQDGSGRLSATDGAYFVFLVLLPFSRWLEFRSGHAQGEEGQPVTSADLGRYTLIVVGGGIALWTGAKLVSVYMIGT